MSTLIIESLRLPNIEKNTIFTLGGYAKAKIDAITIVNTGGSNVTYSIYRVKKGGVASNKNALILGATLKANDTMLLEFPLYLDNSYSIVAQSNTANIVTVHLDAKYI